MAEEQDYAELQKLLAAEVDRVFRENYEPQLRQQQQQQPGYVDPIERQQQELQRQLVDMVRPTFEPAIRNAALRADAAEDKADYYLENPSMVEYKNEIEDAFRKCIQENRPTNRQALADYIIGRERRMNPEKFEEREKARHDREQSRAYNATDFGGSLGKDKPTGSMDDFKALSLEEKEKALEGVTF